MDLYRDDAIASPLVGFGKVWGGLALSFLVTLGVLYTLKVAEDFSRVWIFAWFVVSAAGIVYARSLCLSWLRSKVRQIGYRVALVGGADEMARIEAHLGTSSPLSHVGGKYSVGEARDPSAFDGSLDDLRRALARGGYDQVIICISSSDLELLSSVTRSLGSYCAELLLCTDMSEYPVAVSGSRAIGSIRMDVVNVIPLSERSHLVKTFLDWTFAVIGLVLLSPLLLLVALAIKLDSAGPVLFVQRRYGQNNAIFRIFKFRTMHVADDGPVVHQARRDDPRVTRVGRFLRRTSIDELPQLLNVLFGHMSVVGPRPHAITHDDAFERELDLFSRRRRVRPGITGWSQVNGFRGETPTPESVKQRMEYDLYYIDNWSIWLDLEIIARTLFVVGRGAY
jgi:putative colanic acid biosynthesis UDP-glucose lipid carrier transferase